MKLVFASILLVVIVASSNAQLTAVQKNIVRNMAADCIAQTGADKKLVINLRTGQIADDPKVSAFLVCMYKKIGFLNDAGELQESVIKQRVAQAVGAQVAEKLIANCLVKKSTPEATATEMFKCGFVNTPQFHNIV